MLVLRMVRVGRRSRTRSAPQTDAHFDLSRPRCPSPRHDRRRFPAAAAAPAAGAAHREASASIGPHATRSRSPSRNAPASRSARAARFHRRAARIRADRTPACGQVGEVLQRGLGARRGSRLYQRQHRVQAVEQENAGGCAPAGPAGAPRQRGGNARARRRRYSSSAALTSSVNIQASAGRSRAPAARVRAPQGTAVAKRQRNRGDGGVSAA